MKFNVSALDTNELSKLYKRVVACAQAAAMATGCTLDVNLICSVKNVKTNPTPQNCSNPHSHQTTRRKLWRARIWARFHIATPPSTRSSKSPPQVRITRTNSPRGRARWKVKHQR